MRAVVGRGLILSVLISLFFTGSPVAFASSQDSRGIDTFIGHEPLKSDKIAYQEDGKLFFPLRASFEQLGWQVHWKPGLITLVKNGGYSQRTSHLYLDWENEVRMREGTAFLSDKALGEIAVAHVEWFEEISTAVVLLIAPEDVLQTTEEPSEKEDGPTMTAEESIRLNFGKYEVPPTLKSLMEAAEEIDAEGYDLWDAIGFYPGFEFSGYINTPVDAISFGWTGVDGEHFALLTDFGTATDLEETPVIMVSPMNFDRPAVVVARNLREFLRIAMTDFSLLYMEYENERDYLSSKEEIEKELFEEYGYEETEEDRSAKRFVLGLLEKKLKPPAVVDPYTYSVNAAKEREKRIVAATKDGLGVTNVVPEDSGKTHARLIVDESLDIAELNEFLRTATYASKLAVIRDYNLETLKYLPEIYDSLTKEAERMGIADELARMRAVYLGSRIE